LLFCREIRQSQKLPGVVSPGRILNFAFTKTVGKSLLKSFEMALDPGPNHDSVGIHGLAARGRGRGDEAEREGG